jgi:ribosomal protein S18 acetylase RimI-like enzyme
MRRPPTSPSANDEAVPLTALPHRIRPATRRDAADIALLVDIAGRGLPSYLWSQLAAHGQSSWEVGRARALREEGGFSYRNARIAEAGAEVAGLLIGYPLAEAGDAGGIDSVPEPVRPLLLLEMEATGHWYVNILAIYPEFRGKGIGGLLLAEAETIGRSLSPHGMAIIVDSMNPGALRLYERNGYRVVASRPTVKTPIHPEPGEFLLMTKPFS